MLANDYQIGGDWYRRGGTQHWDRMVEMFGLDQTWPYFIFTATAYLERYRDKNGIQDLKKAKHYIEKLIELEEAEAAKKLEKKQTPTTHTFLEKMDAVSCLKNIDREKLVQNGHGWAEPPENSEEFQPIREEDPTKGFDSL